MSTIKLCVYNKEIWENLCGNIIVRKHKKIRISVCIIVVYIHFNSINTRILKLIALTLKRHIYINRPSKIRFVYP